MDVIRGARRVTSTAESEIPATICPSDRPEGTSTKDTSVSHIFISHSSRDAEQAARLLTWLHANGFSETFLDFDKHAGLAPGADWERTLYRELAGSEAVVLILTKNWFDSKWCFVEFAQARALGKAIFPLIEAPSGEILVSPDIQHLDLLKDREGGLARLASELTEITLNAHGGFDWDFTRPPYPGLLAFDEADAAIYFGRDDDIRRLIERLNARRAQGGAKLVAVLGASGSGKSSLLRAGVLPRLKRDRRNWIALPPFRPQLHPLDELAQAVAIALGSGVDWRQWREAFAAKDLTHTLADLARDLRAARGSNEAQILIAVDQAEELFGAAEKTAADKFLEVLSAMQDERLPFLVALTLRSDYLGQLQQATALTAPFEEFSLKPMPLERLRDIIGGPARVAGLTVDDALVSAAMNGAATDDALPLLAFALRELYDRFGQKKHLTLEAYSALGDDAARLSPLENAVRRKADEVLSAAKPSAEDLQALKEAFVPAMVRVNAEGEYVRRPARFDALPAKARPLIERLAKARLLIIQKEDDATIVEVAHEALLRKWPQLRGWLDEEREFLIGKDQLEQDLRDWEEAPDKEKTEALLTGLKLTRARTWLAAKSLQLSEPERMFIKASAAHHDAAAAGRERLRRRILQGSMAAALVCALVAAGAIWEWRSAKLQESIAESRELAGQSQQALSIGNLDLALRDAVASAGRSPTEESEFALRTVLQGPLEHLIVHSSGPVGVAVYSPDGKRFVTAGGDNLARVWDVETGHLLATLSGHTDRILNAAYSPDGDRIVTASQDKTACVWDAESGHLLATLTGHTDAVDDAEFSPDGKRIVTASRDHTARVWDADSGNLLATLTGDTDAVVGATFSIDGKRILTASEDRTARLWDAETGRPLAALIGRMAKFSPDGKRIVTGSDDDTARIWDAGTGHLIAVLLGRAPGMMGMQDHGVNDVEFSQDGSRVVVANAGDIARVWDIQAGQMLALLAGHTDMILKAAFSPDGNRVVTASYDKTARVWDVKSNNLLATLTGDTDTVWSAAFSADGKHVLTASADATARVWDIDLGHPLVTLTGHTAAIQGASFSADGKRIVTASADKTARVWDVESGQLLATLTGHSDEINNAAFSLDGTRIVTASEDDTARVWDAASGRLLETLSGHTSWVNHAAFSPDEKLVVTAGRDATARVWDAETGHLLVILTGHAGSVNDAEFSPDGKRIVTASDDNTARVWDAASGHLLATLTGHTFKLYTAVFSPNGSRIVTSSGDHTAAVWDSETGHLLATLTGHANVVEKASFSPDGMRVVTASGDNTAKVWDAETGRLLTTLTAHTATVNDAMFSPDGKRIVTASGDNTARLWDPETGQLLGTLIGHTDVVWDAIFSPDGKRIVTAGGDGTARVYIADLDDLLEWAKEQLPIESGK
jgi:WD40 repeat protein